MPMVVVIMVTVVIPVRVVVSVVVPMVVSVVWAIWHRVIRVVVVIGTIVGAIGEGDTSEATIITAVIAPEEGREQKLRLRWRSDSGCSGKREHGCEYQLPHGYLHRFDGSMVNNANAGRRVPSMAPQQEARHRGAAGHVSRVAPVRNSYRRLDLVPVPLAHLAVADRHVQALAMLPCRDYGQVSSSDRASVMGL
jgi:hypothetical protein